MAGTQANPPAQVRGLSRQGVSGAVHKKGKRAENHLAIDKGRAKGRIKKREGRLIILSRAGAAAQTSREERGASQTRRVEKGKGDSGVPAFCRIHFKRVKFIGSLISLPPRRAAPQD